MIMRCFLVAAIVWASALLLPLRPCQAEMLEMSDRNLEEITGQAGSFVQAAHEGRAGGSDSRDENGISEKVRRVDVLPWNWFLDDMDREPGDAGEKGITVGDDRVETGVFEPAERTGAGAGSEMYGLIRYSGNVHVTKMVD